MKSSLAAFALILPLLTMQPVRAQDVLATASDALPATSLNDASAGLAPPPTVAAPAEASPSSTATPSTLSAPAVSTTPAPAPAAAASSPAVQSALAPALADPVIPDPPPPLVEARINLSKQRMEVWVDGVRRYSWPVSTARKGYRTPVGTYQPGRMHKRYFSRKYDNAPMPYAIFFHKGWAIHGTNDLRRLGRPASHGCVRLHPNNARALFALVSEHGRANTRIIVTR